MTLSNQPPQRLVASALFVIALLAALFMHVVPALLAGLLAFVLTRALLGWLKQFAAPRKLLSHELLAALLVGTGSLLALGVLIVVVVRLLNGESLAGLLLTIADTISRIRQHLPQSAADHLPDSVIALKELIATTLKAHAKEVAGLSTHALHSLVLTFVGWITGVLVAVRSSRVGGAAQEQPLFADTWFGLWHRLGQAFSRVATAQVKIAAINAFLTGVFLLVVCPWLGWHIPYAKTLILATFVTSLLPVVGNLISNTMICVLALSVSPQAALAALVFLVVVHKLEYFAAARIQGHEIGAQTWELLIMLFAFEALFGPAGMVAAPIFYAFVKTELRRSNWLS